MLDQERLLLGYRLLYTSSYDPELIWALIQRHQGYISIRAGGEYWFWIPAHYESLLVLAFPELTRDPSLDYV